MAHTPYTRVAHLLSIPTSDLPIWQQRPTVTATPTTLSGDPDQICSYGLTIAYRSGTGYMVYDDKNSATTNRHVSALKSVLEGQGYRPTDETVPVKQGWDRYSTYRKYVK